MSLFKKIFTDDLLNEAQDYNQMYNDIWRLWKMFLQTEDGVIYQNSSSDAVENAEKWLRFELEGDIKWARTVLKKNDRIVWFLRYSKLGIIAALGRTTALETAANYINARIEPQFISKTNEYVSQKYGHGLAGDETQRLRMFTLRDLGDIKNRMEHFLSLPIAGIQNMVFGMNHYSYLINDMRKLEREWTESRKGMLDHDETDVKEVLLRFDDGYVWVDLGRGSCRAEADAMGHCGNVPSEKQGDTILSLRQIGKDGNRNIWRPCLTFILHGNGMLGEMKGRGNDKPAEKYHKYIVALLANPMIKGIVGGGYAPENNFSMADLDEETQKALVHKNPHLMDARVAPQMLGDEKLVPFATKKIATTIYHGLGEYHRFMMETNTLPDDLGNNKWVVAMFGSFEEFLDRFGGAFTNELYQVYDGTNEDLDNMRTYPSTVGEAQEAMPHNSRLYDHVITYCMQTQAHYEEYCLENDLEPEDFDNAFKYLWDENDSGLHQLIVHATTEGYDGGASKYVKDLIYGNMEEGFVIRDRNESYIPITIRLEGDDLKHSDIICVVDLNRNDVRSVIRHPESWGGFVDSSEEARLDIYDENSENDDWREEVATRFDREASNKYILSNYEIELKVYK